jgi:hypothetical protein
MDDTALSPDSEEQHRDIVLVVVERTIEPDPGR